MCARPRLRMCISECLRISLSLFHAQTNAYNISLYPGLYPYLYLTSHRGYPDNPEDVYKHQHLPVSFPSFFVWDRELIPCHRHTHTHIQTHTHTHTQSRWFRCLGAPFNTRSPLPPHLVTSSRPWTGPNHRRRSPAPRNGRVHINLPGGGVRVGVTWTHKPPARRTKQNPV